MNVYLDTWLLLFWVIEVLFQNISGDKVFSLLHTSAFSCFFFYMVNRLFAALCSWLITCFTLIRFLNIFRRFNTIRSNIILLTCLTIFFSLANSYLIVTIEYKTKPISQLIDNRTNKTNDYSSDSTDCPIQEKYMNNDVVVLLNALVAGFLNLALPSMLTFSVNVAIVCYIKHIYKTQNAEPIQRRSESAGANYRSPRSTLLVISITYTLCYLPYCIITLIRIKSPNLTESLYHWAEVALILRYISHSVNFYAYIFTNHRFRRDILLLLRGILRPCAYIKKRRLNRKKSQRKNEILYHHYRLPQPILLNRSAKMIGTYQRSPDLRYSNPHNYARQQNLQTNEMLYNKQSTQLATLTPSHSMEKLRNRTRL